MEVSTPGIDRKFFKAEQLTQFISEEFTLKLRENIDGKKTMTAKLLDVQDNEIVFNCGDENLNLNFLEIDLCRLKPNFDELMRMHK